MTKEEELRTAIYFTESAMNIVGEYNLTAPNAERVQGTFRFLSNNLNEFRKQLVELPKEEEIVRKRGRQKKDAAP